MKIWLSRLSFASETIKIKKSMKCESLRWVFYFGDAAVVITSGIILPVNLRSHGWKQQTGLSIDSDRWWQVIISHEQHHQQQHLRPDTHQCSCFHMCSDGPRAKLWQCENELSFTSADTQLLFYTETFSYRLQLIHFYTVGQRSVRQKVWC